MASGAFIVDLTSSRSERNIRARVRVKCNSTLKARGRWFESSRLDHLILLKSNAYLLNGGPKLCITGVSPRNLKFLESEEIGLPELPGSSILLLIKGKNLRVPVPASGRIWPSTRGRREDGGEGPAERNV